MTPPQKSEVKFNPNVNIERYVRKGDRKTFFWLCMFVTFATIMPELHIKQL